MKRCLILFLIALCSTLFAQQSPVPSAPAGQDYKPKFPGDPARSESEALALAYVRNVVRAEKQFNKQYGHYATSLSELVHSGSFTKRMVDPHRGDYTASYKGKKDSYVLTMTPQMLDGTHRSFYASDDGKIHADDAKAADADSPTVR